MFKRNLIAGVLVWLPIWVTLMVVKVFLEMFDYIWANVPSTYQPRVFFGFDIPGISIVLVVFAFWLTGLLVTNFIGRHVVDFYESLLHRIPLVRSVYHAVKQALSVVFSNKGESFRQVLLIEYPRKGIWSIAFKTNHGLNEVNVKTGEPMVTVFVPTTPNPTSGFLLLVPKSQTQVVDISVESALKYVISLGTVTTENNAVRVTDIDGQVS